MSTAQAVSAVTDSIRHDELMMQTREGITAEGCECFVTYHFLCGSTPDACPVLITGFYSSRDGGGTFSIAQLTDGRYRDEDSGEVADNPLSLLPWVVAEGEF